MRPHEKHGRVWRKNGRGYTRAEPPHKRIQREELAAIESFAEECGITLYPWQIEVLKHFLLDR